MYFIDFCFLAFFPPQNTWKKLVMMFWVRTSPRPEYTLNFFCLMRKNLSSCSLTLEFLPFAPFTIDVSSLRNFLIPHTSTVLVKPNKTVLCCTQSLSKSLLHTLLPLGLKTPWCWQGHIHLSHCLQKPSETQRGQVTYLSSHGYQGGKAGIPSQVAQVLMLRALSFLMWASTTGWDGSGMWMLVKSLRHFDGWWPVNI